MLSWIISASRVHSVAANARNAPNPALLTRMSIAPPAVAASHTVGRAARLAEIARDDVDPDAGECAATSASASLRRAVSTSSGAARGQLARDRGRRSRSIAPVTSARSPESSAMTRSYITW